MTSAPSQGELADAEVGRLERRAVRRVLVRAADVDRAVAVEEGGAAEGRQVRADTATQQVAPAVEHAARATERARADVARRLPEVDRLAVLRDGRHGGRAACRRRAA